MSSQANSLMLDGYLLMETAGCFGCFKKRWRKKYCKIFQADDFRTERLEIFSNNSIESMQTTPTAINVNNCYVVPFEGSCGFTLVTTSDADSIHRFCCNSEIELSRWIEAFRIVGHPPISSQVRTADVYEAPVSSSTVLESATTESSTTKQCNFYDEVACETTDANVDINSIEDDIYSTINVPEIKVKLLTPNGSETHIMNAKTYVLMMHNEVLELRDGCKVKVTWPYEHISNYGYEDEMLVVETTSESVFGARSFVFEHEQLDVIREFICSKFDCMHVNTRSFDKPTQTGDDEVIAPDLEPQEMPSTVPQLPSNPVSSDDETDEMYHQFHEKVNLLESKLNFLKTPPPWVHRHCTDSTRNN